MKKGEGKAHGIALGGVELRRDSFKLFLPPYIVDDLHRIGDDFAPCGCHLLYPP